MVISSFLTDKYLYIHTKIYSVTTLYCLDASFQSLRIGGLDATIDFAQVINRSSGNTKQLLMVLWLCSNASVIICSTTFVCPVVQTGSLIELAIAPMHAGLPL